MKMASTSAVGNLKEELNCSICWNIYTEPVSLSCGHNFCRSCIEKNWDKKDTGPGYSCPECRAEYAQKPILHKNLKLSNIIERFEATQMNEEPPKIFCDFCLDSPLPAVKTCMNCEASLCEHHLRKHSEKAAQKNHLLIEPASSLEDRKCSDHEKLIEYYCLDDHSCICVTCYVAGPHKNHDIRILKDIHNETKASLSEKLENLQSCRLTLEEATKELQGTEVNLKKDSAILRKQISDLFQEIRMLLTKQEKQILDTVITEKNINLSKVLKKIQELEIKREVITHLIQEVQDLKNQKDPLFFIKDFKSTYERISNNNTEVETLRVSWKKLDESTISTIKQETKRIFEMLNTLIFDHPVHSNDEVSEERVPLEDENEEDNLPDSMKPTGTTGEVRRTQYTSLFCKDVPVRLVLEKPARSSMKITTRGVQESSRSPVLQERSMQLATSEQAVVAQLVEETVSRPSARLPMSQEVMQERFRLEDYYAEDHIMEHTRSEDTESTISAADNLVYYAEFEEEGGEMPYVMEDSLDEEYLDVLYMRKRRDKFSTKSV
ncbi:E3 ubiquitin-protein ligase TRIM8-like isoform X2 [Leucoraja erinacea]|uniref:E3 ubiquitin-protein ligase TRIM8-like isoform X2 n=1 Tax=Leucoraja erinaceus TaxID=7782 RepID=UPI002456CFB2|nr:E3 ubiquitin-protein ligase TRIM8-like isoform X2 [Leucoraja erinacea]